MINDHFDGCLQFCLRQINEGTWKRRATQFILTGRFFLSSSPQIINQRPCSRPRNNSSLSGGKSVQINSALACTRSLTFGCIHKAITIEKSWSILNNSTNWLRQRDGKKSCRIFVQFSGSTNHAQKCLQVHVCVYICLDIRYLFVYKYDRRRDIFLVFSHLCLNMSSLPTSTSIALLFDPALRFLWLTQRDVCRFKPLPPHHRHPPSFFDFFFFKHLCWFGPSRFHNKRASGCVSL